ncbi:hypothetical protein, partial [Bacillus cereus]|uniref:hypothetical protein n=1 Tax=Bacillus cereus TaxID=1396 RepID=UPI00345B9DD4
ETLVFKDPRQEIDTPADFKVLKDARAEEEWLCETLVFKDSLKELETLADFTVLKDALVDAE